MAYADTADFADLVVEVEWVASSGTYAKVCGITSRGVNRQSNMATNEVPECDDETLPNQVERNVQSQEVTISGSGVWAKQSHEKMLDWWYLAQRKNIRVYHANVDSGDTEYESGPAFLTQLSNQAEKGQKVTAEVSIEFDGVPTRTAKA